MVSLYEEYEEYVKNAKSDYGPQSVVLYRCGQFYEIYSANDGLVDIKAIADLLNIQVSRRNKSILEVNRTNTLMAGFPMFTLRKFVSLLVQNNYTVVIVDQITNPPKPKRAITEVISPGTNLECDTTIVSNNMMAIYIEDLQDWKTAKPTMGIGVAILDITTGISHVFEAYSKHHDNNYALDEVYRILSIYTPSEIVILGDTALSFQDIMTFLEINSRCVHNKIRTYPPDIEKIAYQQHILSQLYPKTGMLSILEYLDIERLPLATKAFVFIIMFAMKHNQDLLTKIERPIILRDEGVLQLHFNTAKQLNITNNGLAAIINTTCTAIGKRYFIERMLAPLTDVVSLTETYNQIEEFIAEESYIEIRKVLARIYDIPRLMRKMYMSKLHPMEMLYIDESLLAVIELLELVKKSTNKCIDFDIEEIRSSYVNKVMLEVMAKYNIDTLEESIFVSGHFPQVDEIQSILIEYTNVFQELATNIGPLFKLEYNERDGYHFIITAKRFKEFQVQSKYSFNVRGMEYLIDTGRFVSKPVSHSSSNVKVTHPCFAVLTEKIVTLKAKLKVEVTNAFKVFMRMFVEQHDGQLHKIIKFVENVDVLAAHAHNAIKYKYYRPIINNKFDGKSFINAKDMRHPIVEVVNTELCYVANDIAFLPQGGYKGMLLFGLNCSGKTTLSKAVALNVIMAQMGSFVPSKMEYFPYSNIFTRIPCGDDMFKGMSTFAVEMTELRNILKRANHNSLIVGDEVSHGTEVTSGVAIVGAAICELVRRGSHFIFATHIHDLVDIPRIRELESLRMCHMSVHFDAVSGKLVYDRKLQEGSGTSVYGLEVCKALDMPKEFLDIAFEIRDGGRLQGMMEKSRYNQNVYVASPCQICGDKMQEVHHINPQMLAGRDGYITDTHIRKNAVYNLVTVCSKCHDAIHAKKILIKGYVQTNQGIELDYVHINNISQEDEQHVKDIIFGLRQQKQSLSKIKTTLEEHGFNISIYRIQKMLKTLVSMI